MLSRRRLIGVSVLFPSSWAISSCLHVADTCTAVLPAIPANMPLTDLVMREVYRLKAELHLYARRRVRFVPPLVSLILELSAFLRAIPHDDDETVSRSNAFSLAPPAPPRSLSMFSPSGPSPRSPLPRRVTAPILSRAAEEKEQSSLSENDFADTDLATPKPPPLKGEQKDGVIEKSERADRVAVKVEARSDGAVVSTCG